MSPVNDEKPLHEWRGFSRKKSGGVLLSHEVTLAVPSAQKVLASGFGM